MKKSLIIALIIYFLGIFYLVLPEPVIPNLPNSLKSTEPGDTWQLPGVWAYYTNLSRRESIDFYKKSFSRSPFLGIPLPTYKLNHPPEYARETIIDTLNSNLYEELVHPFRESLFISGWIPSEDEVYLRQTKEPTTHFQVEGQRFSAKMTLYHVQSPIWARILIWTVTFIVGGVLVLTFKKIIFSPWFKRK